MTTIVSRTRERLAAIDWAAIERQLDERGWATTGRILDAADCQSLVAMYDEENRFRSKVTMARHGFGRGEYQYFSYPLPGIVEALRTELYSRLVSTANAWRTAFGSSDPFPADHGVYLAQCRAAGQARPTPLLLRYGPEDYNCLHQDLYGDLFFPFQAAFLLSAPSRDFDGGEFVLTEQRPRMQSRVHVLPLLQGEAAIFAVNHRPVNGTRGTYRVSMRHGVSPVRAGRRHTLGIILHDAA